jgi:hypothetical protein
LSLPHPDEIEVLAGVQREELQGTAWTFASDEERQAGLEKAFDYRGDITLTLVDGTILEGYLFDRQVPVPPEPPFLRMFPKGSLEKRKIGYDQVTGLVFSGRDTAAGKSWEAWMKRYAERKAAGETGIELTPESLDD